MKISIQWTYQSKKKEKVFLTSELVSVEEALRLATDMEQTQRGKEFLFVDQTGVSWRKKELEKLIKEIEAEPSEVVVYFDGGYDKQTKIAGIGVSIYYKQGNKTYRIRRNEQLEGLENNNEAEYAAFELGIHELMELAVHHQEVTFKGDSQVVLYQLTGEWASYEESFHKYLERIEKKLKKHAIVPICEVITRKENKEAHQLATQGIQGIKIASHLPLDGEK